MCGRYSFSPGKDFFDRFSLDPDYDRGSDLPSSFNVSPGQFMPIIIKGEKYNDLHLMRWGLIPSWAKDEKNGFKMLNARAESVAVKPSFKASFRRHRCLVPANGFYEWGKNKKVKTPTFYNLKNESIFSFAGLFDTWHHPNGSELETYTIITTTPNDLVAQVHDRMPVILSPDSEKLWLSTSTSESDLESLLTTYPSELMASTFRSPSGK